MPVNKIGTGTRVGMLTVAEATDGRRNGYTVWKCRFDCGGEVDAPLHQLTAGYRVSCGCLQVSAICDTLKLADGTSVTRLEASLAHPSVNNTSGHTGSASAGNGARRCTSTSSGSTAMNGWRMRNRKPSARGNPLPLAYNSGRKEETPIWISE